MPAPRTQKLSALTTIAGALVLGVVAFAGAAMAIGASREPDPSAVTLTYVLVGVSVALLSTHDVVLRVVDTRTQRALAARRQEALDELSRGDCPPELTQRTILALALGESIALLGPVTYMIGGSPLAAAPLALGLGWMALQFPSRDRLREAVERAGRAGG